MPRRLALRPGGLRKPDEGVDRSAGSTWPEPLAAHWRRDCSHL